MVWHIRQLKPLQQAATAVKQFEIPATLKQRPGRLEQPRKLPEVALNARFTNKPPQIDGKFDDACW
jgi:hypothetical protein